MIQHQRAVFSVEKLLYYQPNKARQIDWTSRAC